MSKDGKFIRRNGFTIIGNTVARDRNLSFKAKGLYSLIQSYISFDTLVLTKSYLVKNCKEGHKAFESAWKELKNAGYLKVYMQSIGGSWSVEYQLLDEPKEGPHTIYMDKDGNEVSDNIKRTENQTGTRDDQSEDHTPPNGGNGAESDRISQKGTNAMGGNALGDNGNRDNNINTKDKTNSNTLYNPSIYPYTSQDIERMSELYEEDFESDFERNAFPLFCDALSEMTSQKGNQRYSDLDVNAVTVINRIDRCMEEMNGQGFSEFTKQVIKDYINGISVSDVKFPKKYMKTCIWNCFSTYQSKVDALYLRTYKGDK